MKIWNIAIIISFVFVGLGASLAGVLDATKAPEGVYFPCVLLPFILAISYAWLAKKMFEADSFYSTAKLGDLL